MKLFVFIISIVIAIVSLSCSDTLLRYADSILDVLSTTAAASDLGTFPTTSIYVSSKPGNMTVPRAIRKAFLAVEQAEGAGARVRRSIGTPQLRNFSPFLMLDHFSIKPGAGFPDHPHRGQGEHQREPIITNSLTNQRNHNLFARRRSRP